MQLMGESSSSRSSSKPTQSGSTRRQQHQQQQQQHPAQIDSHEEQRNDTKSNDALRHENRLEIKNIAKVSPPSVIIPEDEKEHPLLYLHQSVTGTSTSREREGNGNRSMHENKLQPSQMHQQQPLLPPKRDSSSEMNGKGKKRETSARNVRKNKPLMAMLKAAVLIISLIFLGRPYVHSVINNMSTGSAMNMLLDLCTTLSTAQLHITNFVKSWDRHKLLSILPTLFDTEKAATIPTDQLEQRLELGFDLLRKYDDASGSLAVCESVLHALILDSEQLHDESWLGRALYDVNENRLLSKAFRCMGEARLALFSSSDVSQSFKKELLSKAKDSFESATAVDPTEPSVRGGLGLVYLLLGMDNDESNNNNQFKFQSIQHLKAAVGLIDKSDRNQSDDAIAIRMAAMHNLGLAYILLDGESSSEAPAGVKATHFIDWVTSLRSSQSELKSWVISSNEGAMLLQMGKFEEAIIQLELTSEVCSDALPFSRQKEACAIVHQNLAMARNALHEKETIATMMHFPVDDEERRNAAALSIVESSKEYVTETSDGHAGNIETNGILADKESNEPIKADTNTGSSTPFGPTAIKPEMQDALSALEKAATEGTQRTHLLLSLARARASTGDISGAVDSALRAVSAANSGDELDTSTSYLDKLMAKMAGEGSEQKVHVFQEDQSSGKSDESTTFVEKKDLSFLELEMKLELERLRYKVLEQEMRLGYRSSNSPPNLDHFRAIDYQQERNAASDIPPKRVSEVIDESVVTSQTAIKIADYNTTVDVIPEEASPLDDAHADKIEELNHDLDGSDANLEDDAESAENQPASADHIASANSGIIEITQNTSVSDDQITVASEDDADSVAIELPPLFSPVLKSPTPISPTAKSYMKMADAYLDKRQYTLASKQFLKVIKKAPEHLPAYLGYATALERAGNTKQMHTAALAYGNATKLAITQGDKVDPLAMTGTGGIGENILRRAVVLAKTSPHKKLETLKQLNAYAHTAVIAADIYHEIGLEIVRQGIEQEDKKRDAIQAFSFANEFIATRNDTQTPYHVGSIVELGKLALLKDDARSVIDLFNKVKNVHMEDDVHVELLVLVGRAYVILGELETAITEFTRALSFPESSSTASAHYELASTLKKNNGDEHEINLHFEMALNLGMDPSSEVIDALGENSMAVVRALRRQHYRSMNDDVQSDTRAGGGIMSGGGVHSTSSSAFAPQSKHSEDATTGQSETLSILEQGAASYDGHTPMGGGIEGTESSLSNLKAKKQQGSESNLSSLRR